MAESLDWAMSLVALHAAHLEAEAVTETLGAILKDRDDVARLAGARTEAIVGELTSLDEDGLRSAPTQIAQRIDKELVPRICSGTLLTFVGCCESGKCSSRLRKLLMPFGQRMPSICRIGRSSRLPF